MQSVMSVNKSSIDFLLSDNKKSKDEFVFIEPKTLPKSDKTKFRKILRPTNPELSLELIQQPTHAKVTPRLPARVFPPFAEHRPIHPPPVLQLKVNNFKPNHEYRCDLDDEYLETLVNSNDPKSVERIEELRVIRQLRKNTIPSWTHYSTFFVITRLRSEDEQDVSHLFHVNQYEKSLDDLLIGTKVSSGMCLPLKLVSPSNSYLKKTLPKENLHSSDFATTFVFSDLSVKKVGKFKLKFDLFEVFEGKIYKRCETFSNEFQVFTPKKFPGSSPSTPLTAFLFKQGARIRQRKRPLTKKISSDSDSENSKQKSKTRKVSDIKNEDTDDTPPVKKISQGTSIGSISPHTPSSSEFYPLPPVSKFQPTSAYPPRYQYSNALQPLSQRHHQQPEQLRHQQNLQPVQYVVVVQDGQQPLQPQPQQQQYTKLLPMMHAHDVVYRPGYALVQGQPQHYQPQPQPTGLNSHPQYHTYLPPISSVSQSNSPPQQGSMHYYLPSLNTPKHTPESHQR